MWNLEKWYRWTYLQGRNTDAVIENRGVARVGVNGGMNWETDRSLFIGSTTSDYFLKCPEESNGRVCGGNPELRLFLNVQTLGVSRTVIHSCQIQRQKFKTAVYSLPFQHIRRYLTLPVKRNEFSDFWKVTLKSLPNAFTVLKKNNFQHRIQYPGNTCYE